jgi:hypothetical protein
VVLYAVGCGRITSLLHGTAHKDAPPLSSPFGAALSSPHLALRLTVEINNKINQTAFGAEQGASVRAKTIQGLKNNLLLRYLYEKIRL